MVGFFVDYKSKQFVYINFNAFRHILDYYMPFHMSQVLLWKFLYHNLCNIYANMHRKWILLRHCVCLEVIPLSYRLIIQFQDTNSLVTSQIYVNNAIFTTLSIYIFIGLQM